MGLAPEPLLTVPERPSPAAVRNRPRPAGEIGQGVEALAPGVADSTRRSKGGAMVQRVDLLANPIGGDRQCYRLARQSR
jgi:hypothetical protein